MNITNKSLSWLSLAVVTLASPAALAQPSAWEKLTPQTDCTARHEAALTALDGKLYLLGGRGIKPVEEFDPQANTWKQLAPTPMQFHHFQPLALEGRIVVVGAMTGGYPKEPPVTNVWFFDPRQNQWAKGPQIPLARARGGAGTVLADGKIYLVGGNTNGHWNGFVPWVDVLDLKSGQWTALADAPRARDHFQAVLLEGKIVAAGGRRTYGERNQVFDLTVPEVDVYEIASRKWTTLSEKIPTPRAGCFAATRDGKVIVLGGESMKQPTAHSEVEALLLATGKWEKLPALNQGRHGTGAAFIGDTLYLAAGCGKRGGSPELHSMEQLHWPTAKN